MKIEIEGVQDSTLLEFISRELIAALEPRRPKPVAIRVGFADENGPKGGIDIRCGLTLEQPRRPRLRVETTAATHRLAFDGTLQILERQLAREGEHLREVRRRPKKYYAAKRVRLSDSQPQVQSWQPC